MELTWLPADLNVVELPRSGPEFAGLVEGSYLRLSLWLAEHLPQVGTLIAGTAFSLYGRYITEILRRIAHRWPFPLRAGLYIGVVGIGFGAIIATVSPVITAGLRLVGTYYLVPATLSAFILIGILAERSGRI